MQQSELCRSLAGNPCPLITITNPTTQPHVLRPAVVFTGQYCMRKLIFVPIVADILETFLLHSHVVVSPNVADILETFLLHLNIVVFLNVLIFC